MSTPDQQAEWEALSQRLRQFCLRVHHYEPIAVTFEGPSSALRYTHAIIVPMPVQPLWPPQPPASVNGHAVETRDWNTGPVPKCREDLAKVYWPGLGTYTFTATQWPIVRVLWEAYQDGTHEVSMKVLLASTRTDATKLATVFDRNGAWGRLIVTTGRGYYRLAPLQPAREEPGETHWEPPDPDE